MQGGKLLYLADAAATEALGEELAGQLSPGDVVLLQGPLGAGKTTLVRGLVRALGGDPGEVCSPTFILRESYRVGGRGGIFWVHHLDLYRLRGKPRAVWEELGVVELLDDPQGVCAVEWSEELPGKGLASRVLRVQLAWEGEGRAARVWWETASA
jgi:tRNA threonylcarbamoyl adenosine modification protein YjeE